MSEEASLKQVLPIVLAERLFPPPGKLQVKICLLSASNFHGNNLEQHLRVLLNENEKLQSRLAEIDKDIKDIVELSNGLDKRFTRR